MSGARAYLVCCTEVILNECAHKEIKRASVASSYAHAIRSEHAKVDQPDWKRINEAIRERWSESGLNWIKNRAWKLVSGEAVT